MRPQLTRFQRHTYDAVFHHPDARHLGWRNMRSILGALGDVVEGAQWEPEGYPQRAGAGPASPSG